MDVYLERKRARRNRPARESGLSADDTVRLIDAGGNNRGLMTLIEAEAEANRAGLELHRLKQRGDAVCKIGPPIQVEGKKSPTPQAACGASDPGSGTWAEVELYRDKQGHWVSFLSPGSGTQIITAYDHARFMLVFTEG